MKTLLLIFILLAPVPKELRKVPVVPPRFPDVKTADNATLKKVAQDQVLTCNMILYLESPEGGGSIIDAQVRKDIFSGIGNRPDLSRYWLLKAARHGLGGRKSEVDPDD
jgi:hypothetical protein